MKTQPNAKMMNGIKNQIRNDANNIVDKYGLPGIQLKNLEEFLAGDNELFTTTELAKKMVKLELLPLYVGDNCFLYRSAKWHIPDGLIGDNMFMAYHRAVNRNTESLVAKIKWAKIADYTGYDSTNGGKYGFWEKYKYVGEGSYRLTYHTTASGFSWCEYCGSFSDGCCDGPQYISESELWSLIKAAENNDSEDVWAEYELFDNAEWLEKLRRRVRDSLNKTTDEKAIISCACALNVSLE